MKGKEPKKKFIKRTIIELSVLLVITIVVFILINFIFTSLNKDLAIFINLSLIASFIFYIAAKLGLKNFWF
jgi:hypothetical protein